MRIEGSFIDEKGVRRKQWFDNVESIESLKEHLSKKGWQILSIDKTKYSGSFKNENGDIVRQAFLAISDEDFYESLSKMGWQLIDLKEPYLLTEQKRRLRVAPLDKRCLNGVIDQIVIYLLSFLFFFMLAVFGIRLPGELFDNRALGYIISLPFFLLFYFLFEVNFGKTPGKFLTKTKVVMRNGAKPKAKDIALRTLLRLIPLEVFTFMGKEPWGLHDTSSQTCVVDDCE